MSPAPVATGDPIAGVWPLFGLRLRSERLLLRPPGDSEIAALAVIAREGIHEPDELPFENRWTSRAGSEFGVGFAQYFWSQRAHWSPDSWALPFAVFLDGSPIGVQQIKAENFPVVKTVSTGSWLGRPFQGRGLGTEMRAAVLQFAFAVLGADVAVSGAYVSQKASISVSEKLGYRSNGTRRDRVGDRALDAVLFRLDRQDWEASSHSPVEIEGVEGCLHLFGVET